jgi:hypothetical protein
MTYEPIYQQWEKNRIAFLIVPLAQINMRNELK